MKVHVLDDLGQSWIVVSTDDDDTVNDLDGPGDPHHLVVDLTSVEEWSDESYLFLTFSQATRLARALQVAADDLSRYGIEAK